MSIPYVQYLVGKTAEDIAGGKCPECGGKMIDGAKTAFSPKMIDEHRKSGHSFVSRGCAACLLEFCREDRPGEVLWFRPAPRLTTK